MNVRRFENNPILSPSSNYWENQATFNPAVTRFNNNVCLLYRALGVDNISRFGWADSSDGKTFERFSEPIIEPDPKNPFEQLGLEDPRITKIGDTYYIVYTAVSTYEGTSGKNDLPESILRPLNWRIRPSLIATKNFRQFERLGAILELGSKDGSLFPETINGQYVLLHRIYPDIYLTYAKEVNKFDKGAIILRPRQGFWDSERVGAASVPIKTSFGWLVFYHGVDQDHSYRLGVSVLDLNDPTKIIYRGNQPIFEPETDYEKNGLTPNVIFSGGVLEIGNELYIYYGAADKVTGLAILNKVELLAQIQADL